MGTIISRSIATRACSLSASRRASRRFPFFPESHSTTPKKQGYERWMNRFLAGGILGVWLGAFVPPASAAQEDVVAKLRAFEEKIAATAAPAAAAFGDAPPRESQARGRVIAQLRMLRALLAREEFEPAQQLLTNLHLHELPPELQAAWLELSGALLADLGKLRADAVEKWVARVEELVKEVRAQCAAAKTAAELDPLLVRCAALQMQRLGPGTVLGQRAERKMAGVITTLETWASFLDFRAAGNMKAANDLLRNLAANSSHFPVLTVAEIEAQYLPVEKAQPSSRAALQRLIAGVATLDELPGALERLEILGNHPEAMQSHGSFAVEKKLLQAMQEAWQNLKLGNDEAAMRAFDLVTSTHLDPELQAHYGRLKEQFVRRLLSARVKRLSDLSPEPKEDLQVYLGRVLDFLEKIAALDSGKPGDGDLDNDGIPDAEESAAGRPQPKASATERERHLVELWKTWAYDLNSRPPGGAAAPAR